MPSTYSSDLITAVRLLIPDNEQVYGAAENEHMFTDIEIAIYLDQGQGNAKWAAGLASLAIGGSEALIQKWVRNYETQTNGPAVQREWTAKGKYLCELGKTEVEEEVGGIFEIVFPAWGGQRHPEGETHGSYRAYPPGSYQW